MILLPRRFLKLRNQFKTSAGYFVAKAYALALLLGIYWLAGVQMEIVTIVALCCLLLVQQYVYLSQIQRLVDKLMSRDYSEYSANERFKQKQTPKVKVNQPADDRLEGLAGLRTM